MSALINDIQSKVIIQEDEYSPTSQQHVIQDVLDNDTNILLAVVYNNLENDKGSSLENRGSSSRIQKNHSIENIIGYLNERAATH